MITLIAVITHPRATDPTKSSTPRLAAPVSEPPLSATPTSAVGASEVATTGPTGRQPAAGIVAVAWPTGRAIYSYTREQITAGVDVYTRALKAAARRHAACAAGREAP
ncbi:hypothetical protein [Cryptosporangium minutisporangium]|uniref:Uncharacterized protein n=1 Tax=Cryptosporangium minutisporangium TaxID=113569 RepID=A0ABP6SXR7_9ACTN